MSDKSKIEWTDATWNPVRGCTKISPGCVHCYAETFAERFRGVPGHPFEFGFDLRLVPEKLGDPLRWGTSRMIFVNSMSDLFHKEVPDDFIVSVARVMTAANWHTYQVLTKRADRLQSLLKGKLRFAAEQNHIWWGVSGENRQHGLPRVDLLRQAPAKVRFLSVEPLLEHLGPIKLKGINWVIVGGESGPGARPGFAAFGPNAVRKVLRSSSSNGAALENPQPADCSMVAPTANFPSECRLKLRPWTFGAKN
jgi:protein gp37